MFQSFKTLGGCILDLQNGLKQALIELWRNDCQSNLAPITMRYICWNKINIFLVKINNSIFNYWKWIY